MTVAVAGAGAFGTALAIALSSRGPVLLWSHNQNHAMQMQQSRMNDRRLSGIPLPEDITITHEIADLASAEIVLVAIPTQQVKQWVETNADLLSQKTLVMCCKGIDLSSRKGPATQVADMLPNATAAMLTGPSFAVDIARQLPTALTLACASAERGMDLQKQLSTEVLRLYRTTDVIGAELGGALKNVIAIACGVCMGAGFGESARAALVTRGFSEMQRLGSHLGAEPETLLGLSGFGDLTLTCTSPTSRNYRFGLSIGKGEAFDPSITVEGAATARAVLSLSETFNIEMPITQVVTKLCDAEMTAEVALKTLLSRPLKEE